MFRNQLKNEILRRLSQSYESFSEGSFKFWIIDDLLPLELAEIIADNFPEEDILRKRDTLREYKRVGVDFDRYRPEMEDITYVFHDKEVVDSICSLTGFSHMLPDTNLYAGGLSSMSRNSFLKPHLDNSHCNTPRISNQGFS